MAPPPPPLTAPPVVPPPPTDPPPPTGPLPQQIPHVAPLNVALGEDLERQIFGPSGQAGGSGDLGGEVQALPSQVFAAIAQGAGQSA